MEFCTVEVTVDVLVELGDGSAEGGGLRFVFAEQFPQRWAKQPGMATGEPKGHLLPTLGDEVAVRVGDALDSSKHCRFRSKSDLVRFVTPLLPHVLKNLLKGAWLHLNHFIVAQTGREITWLHIANDYGQEVTSLDP